VVKILFYYFEFLYLFFDYEGGVLCFEPRVDLVFTFVEKFLKDFYEDLGSLFKTTTKPAFNLIDIIKIIILLLFTWQRWQLFDLQKGICCERERFWAFSFENLGVIFLEDHFGNMRVDLCLLLPSHKGLTSEVHAIIMSFEELLRYIIYFLFSLLLGKDPFDGFVFQDVVWLWLL